jgi:hypothetical protein
MEIERTTAITCNPLNISSRGLLLKQHSRKITSKGFAVNATQQQNNKENF